MANKILLPIAVVSVTIPLLLAVWNFNFLYQLILTSFLIGMAWFSYAMLRGYD